MPLSVDENYLAVVFVPFIVNNKTPDFEKYSQINYLLREKLIESSDITADMRVDNVLDSATKSLRESIVLPKLNLRINASPNKVIFYRTRSSDPENVFINFIKKICPILAKENLSAIGVNYDANIFPEDNTTSLQKKIIEKHGGLFIGADDSYINTRFSNDDGSETNIGFEQLYFESENRFCININYNLHREIAPKQARDAVKKFVDDLPNIGKDYEKHVKRIEDFFNDK